MTVESAADRAAILEDFGSVVTWTVGATASTLTAIFDRPSIAVEMADMAIIDRDASLKCIEDDIPAGAAAGDAVAVAGVAQAYKVQAIRVDGQGMAVIDLKKSI